MAEVTKRDLRFMAVLLIFIPITGKKGIVISVCSDCRSQSTVEVFFKFVCLVVYFLMLVTDSLKVNKLHCFLLKTSNGILQFLSFDWLKGIMAHIPLTTNMVADTRQQKKLGSSNIAILRAFLIKQLFHQRLRSRSRYEIVIVNEARTIYHLISNGGI